MAKSLPSAAYDLTFALEKQATHDGKWQIDPEYRKRLLTGTWAAQLDWQSKVITDTAAYITARQSSARPMVPSEESAWRAKLMSDVASRYPHICPRCQGPAYVGAVEVDCAGNCK